MPMRGIAWLKAARWTNWAIWAGKMKNMGNGDQKSVCWKVTESFT